VCLICFDDHVNRVFVIIHFYELISQLQFVFLLFLCFVSIVCSSFQRVSSFQISKKTRSKISEKFLPAILQTSKQSVKFSFFLSSSEHVMNPVFSFLSLFFFWKKVKLAGNDQILLTTIHTYDCWTSSSDISGYHADFHEGHGTVGSMARTWHGMCELARHGMAGTRYGMCELAFTRQYNCRWSWKMVWNR